MKIQNGISINDINDTVQTIAKKYNPEKIILFGSYADGNPTPESDVDLLIIIKSDKSNWEISIDISLLLPSRSIPKPARWIALEPVSDKAPMVRP